MDKTEAVTKAHKYLRIIEGFIKIDKALLFGSYQHGSQRDDSDIDIALFITSGGEDYSSLVKKLYRARRDVDPRIEPHLFIQGMDRTGFSDEIEKTGELLRSP
jgi:predicted nucleotidyltransferase